MYHIRVDGKMSDILNRLPKHLVYYIKSFIFPSSFSNTFDVRIYPIEIINSTNVNQIYSHYLLHKRLTQSNIHIEYKRLRIKLPSSTFFNLVCHFDIIDTLIFDKSVNVFYVNDYKFHIKNGIFNPLTTCNVPWFFVPFLARQSQIIIVPSPKEIIGGFLYGAHVPCVNDFVMGINDIVFNYSYNDCYITVK